MEPDPETLLLRFRNLVGWTWLTHGALLIVGAPALLGLAWLVDLPGPGLLRDMPPPQRLQFEHLRTVMHAMARAWPVMLVLGVLVVPPAAAFLRRVPWSRTAVEALTWLHVLVVFPGLVWWTLTLPPVLLQFDAHGQPVESMRWASHVSHVVTGAAMEGLAIYLLVVIRRPLLRDAYRRRPVAVQGI